MLVSKERVPSRQVEIESFTLENNLLPFPRKSHPSRYSSILVNFRQFKIYVNTRTILWTGYPISEG